MGKGDIIVLSGMENPERWLVSTTDELEIDGGSLESGDSDFQEGLALYPPADADLETKLSWMQSVIARAEGTEWYEAMKNILMNCAPEDVLLEIHMKRSTMKDFKMEESPFDLEQFQNNLPIFGRGGFKHVPQSERTWDNYKTWLLETDQPHLSSGSMDTDTVVIGTMQFTRECLFTDCILDCAIHMGFGDSAKDCSLLDKVKLMQVTDDQWGFQDKVGENVYVKKMEDKRLNSDDQGPNLCVRVLIELKQEDIYNQDNATFMKEQHLIKRSVSKVPNEAPTYIFVPREGKTVPLLVNAENFHVSWEPEEYGIQKERIHAHFREGKGETMTIQESLRYENTSSGNLRLSFFEKHMYHMKDFKNWRTKFGAALALTEVASEDTSWVHDNEYPEDTAKAIKHLAMYWRQTLLRRNDENLGIEVPGVTKDSDDTKAGGEPAGDGISDSRKGLMRRLGVYATRFEQASPHVHVKFTLKLGHSRNPNAPNALNKKRKVVDEEPSADAVNEEPSAEAV
uniref:Uncharacterized protein n=1 Tax=Attheya septentrionalis TaxID=420275 RepID=A0A7S2XRK9_9STRA|mmetsp:Transcript_29460/g.53974  ORF Transcript_29460/g.53974 Transcript_29460/m.53974 type:complete len:512 (+) Transcript_29460:267-1802(+)